MPSSEETIYDPFIPAAADVALGCVILYKNILIGSTLTVTNTASGYSVNNIIDYRSYTKWKSNTTDNQTIQGVLSAAIAPIKQADDVGYILTVGGKRLHTVAGGGLTTFGAADCIGIFNHNLSGTTITVKYDQNGTMVTLATITPTSNDPILYPFERHESNKWQVIITGLTAAAEVAVMFLGEAIYFPYLPRAPYTPKDEGIEVMSEVSQAGHLLGSVVAHHPVSINPVWELILRTWFNDNLVPFWDDHGKLLKPFFFGWDLNNRPDDIFYCWIDPAMRFKEILTTLNYSDEFSLLLKSVNTQ
jgi:hypothetical protein